MKVHLSNNDQLRTFDVFLGNFDPSNPTKLQITTHDGWINVHPAILGMVAALGIKVGKGNVTIDEVVGRSGAILETMGLFKVLGIKSQFEEDKSEPAGKFIPLSQIRTPDEQTQFIHDMVPLLRLEPEQADALKYTLGELVRNVLEHSDSPNGAIVAAQYSPEKGVVRIGICDAGVGIKRAMALTWPQKTHTDLDAIKWALVPGVSGTTVNISGTSDNAGAGLFIVKSISMLTRNYFIVYSGSGVYKLLKLRTDVRSVKLNANPDRDKNTQSDLAPEFPGTLTAIDISVEKVKKFAILLEQIKNAFSSAIKERRAERYRPRFI